MEHIISFVKGGELCDGFNKEALQPLSHPPGWA